MDFDVWKTIGDHIVVSLVPWIIAALVGGSIGYLSASLIHSWIRRSPNVFRFLGFSHGDPSVPGFPYSHLLSHKSNCAMGSA